jgi:hypothetical protein
VALFKTQQVHVNNYIISNGQPSSASKLSGDWPLRCSIESNVILRNYHEIIEIMDPTNGLLDELLSVGSINFRHKEYIETRESRVNKNETLLSILLKRSVSDFNKFIHCLEKTKQHQVVSLLKSDVTANNRPLCEEHKRRLLANYSTLISLIDSRQGLLAELLSVDCITQRQKEFVESGASQSESNQRLLDIVMRGSQSDFEKFIKGLIRSGQQQVCRVLLEDAVLMRIVAKLCSITRSNEYTLLYNRTKSMSLLMPSVNIKEVEQRIVKQFKKILSRSSAERKLELLDFLTNLDNDLQLIGVKKGSIELYYLCTSLSGLQHLYELHTSGRLQLLFNQVLTSLTNESGLRLVKVDSFSLSISDYFKSMKYMCFIRGMSVFATVYELAGKTPNVDINRGTVAFNFERLPSEVIEILLMKTVGKLYAIFNMVIPRAEVYTLATLSAVSRHWYQTLISRQYMKRVMQRYFKRVCSPFKCRPHLMQRLHCNAAVRGMAEFNNKLYVVCESSSTIQVFNSSPPFSRLADIEVRGLNDPSDIVVCSDTSQLYIADLEQRAIWRVNLLSYKQVDKFISTQWQPYQSVDKVSSSINNTSAMAMRCLFTAMTVSY